MYISDKACVCYTSDTLKILMLYSQPVYIIMGIGTLFDSGALFYCCFDVLT